MHPAYNLLIPLLRKHGDRLLKAQIQAMINNLSQKDQEHFLKEQLFASIEEIRDKLIKSYPKYLFFTEWNPQILKSNSKTWLFALSGEANYLSGIDDFTLTLSTVELGKPLQIIGLTASSATQILIDKNNSILRNNYKMHPSKSKYDHKKLARESFNEIEDYILEFRGIIEKVDRTEVTTTVEKILRAL